MRGLSTASTQARVPVLLLLVLGVFLARTSCAERAYPSGCANEARSFYDYESSSFPPADVDLAEPEDYLLVRRLGAGKFSDVFEAVDVHLQQQKQSQLTLPAFDYQEIDPDTLVVLKCLKPVSERKIKRELMILRRASHLPNLVRLLAVSLPPNYSQNAVHRKGSVRPMPALVLEHAGVGSQWLCHMKDDRLTDFEIRYFVYQLLVALDALHAKGIMHRDVKPRNVLINRRQDTGMLSKGKVDRPLTLIDLGLADFYLPDTRYNVRVASRHYKSPELLLGYEHYDYAIDLWGVGCILAGLLLNREPFFRGKDNLDQLGTIIAVLGISDLHAYLSQHEIEVSDEVRQVIHKYAQRGAKKVDWFSYLPSSDGSKESHGVTGRNSESTRADNAKVAAIAAALSSDHEDDAEALPPSADGLDLISKLLVYDHEERWTAEQAMRHRFFDPVREQVLKDLGSVQDHLQMFPK